MLGPVEHADATPIAAGTSPHLNTKRQIRMAGRRWSFSRHLEEPLSHHDRVVLLQLQVRILSLLDPLRVDGEDLFGAVAVPALDRDFFQIRPFGGTPRSRDRLQDRNAFATRVFHRAGGSNRSKIIRRAHAR